MLGLYDIPNIKIILRSVFSCSLLWKYKKCLYIVLLGGTHRPLMLERKEILVTNQLLTEYSHSCQTFFVIKQKWCPGIGFMKCNVQWLNWYSNWLPCAGALLRNSNIGSNRDDEMFLFSIWQQSMMNCPKIHRLSEIGCFRLSKVWTTHWSNCRNIVSMFKLQRGS